ILSVRISALLLSGAYVRAGLLTLLHSGCVLFYISLKVNPSSGPTLTNVSLSHIREMVQISVSVMFGHSFASVVMHALQTSTPTDHLLAAVVTLGFVVACSVGVLRAFRHKRPVELSARLRAIY